MRCVYLVRGKRCRRQAAPGADLCPYHLEWVAGPLTPNTWAARVARDAHSSSPAPADQVAQLRLLLRYGPTQNVAAPTPQEVGASGHLESASRCAYVARGKRCRRRPAPDARFCPYHLAWVVGPAARDPWARRVSKEARQLRTRAYQKDGLDDELALLRLLIRESFADRKYDATRRAIDALARALRVRQRLQRSSPTVGPDLARLLDQLAAEPGQEPTPFRR